jgi:hypothetical protein
MLVIPISITIANLGKTMQFTQKYIISISAVAILVTLGYITLQKPTISSSDRGGISTISQSGIETDSLKRLETVANASTPWGMSPFGSGKPLTEEARLIFKQPSTEWRTRTLSGITYVSGEGNPSEIQSRLDNAYNSQYADGVTVRPQTEKFLSEFLSNPMLNIVVNKCGSLIKPRDSITTGLEVGLPETLFTTDFSLESMITIDPSTGEKILDSDKFNLFGIMFQQISFPVSEDTSVPWKVTLACLSTGEIREYQKLVYQYLYTNMSWMNSFSMPVIQKGDF